MEQGEFSEARGDLTQLQKDYYEIGRETIEVERDYHDRDLGWMKRWYITNKIPKMPKRNAK